MNIPRRNVKCLINILTVHKIYILIKFMYYLEIRYFIFMHQFNILIKIFYVFIKLFNI